MNPFSNFHSKKIPVKIICFLMAILVVFALLFYYYDKFFPAHTPTELTRSFNETYRKRNCCSSPTTHIVTPISTRRWSSKSFDTNVRLKNILAQKPPKFLPNFTNPCWYDHVRANRLNCLPYFFIIGFQKCGSSTFYSRIIRHPNIISGCTKEPEFWMDSGYNSRLRSYTKCFSDITNAYSNWTKHHTSNETPPKLITVDSCVAIIWQDYLWKRLPENANLTDMPRVSNGDLIKHVLPDARFIVLMRNPVDRLYSAYTFFARRQFTSPEHFHELVLAGITAVNECLAHNRTIRWCVYNEHVRTVAGELTRNDTSYRFTLIVGLYIVYIERWLEIFPREQMLFIRIEDYRKDNTGVLARTFQFLDIGMPSEEVIHKMLHVSFAHKRKYPKMLASTRTLLTNFYRPYNEKLALTIGDQKFLWRDNYEKKSPS